MDEGVLRPGPVCEFYSELAVEAQGGIAVQPWRDRHLAAVRAEIESCSDATEVASQSFDQVIVHLQKSRAATFDDLIHAWRILRPGGQLLFTGTNSLGVVSAVKKLAGQLDQTGIVVANRARARVVRFKRDDGQGPQREETPTLTVEVPGHPKASGTADSARFDLATAPGVFSARKLDAGTAILLEALADFVAYKPPKRIVDLGCGTGVLGLAAAHLWAEAEVLMVDADARAVRCARKNIEALGMAERCRAEWWDSREPPLEDGFGLALVNPPFHHRGPEVDLGPAMALFESLGKWLKPRKPALIIANRTLPYEAPLAELGQVETLRSARGYKLLSFESRARSSGPRGRRSPGARSEGRSKRPIRSR